MPSEVIAAARGFKRDLLVREEQAMAEMGQAWRSVMFRLDAEINLLAQEMLDRKRSGLPVKAWHVYRMERYQQLLQQVAGEWQTLTPLAESIVISHQRTLAALGVQHGSELVTILEPGASSMINRLPIPAVQNMVGIAGNGKPLGRLIEEVAPAAVDGMTRQFVQGVALGVNPRKLAVMASRGFGVGLNRLLVISRTETLRVYRQASLERWEQTQIVEGHQRVCSHDSRVCPACLADEGHVYPLRQPISEHPQGRCTSIPVITEKGPTKWVSGGEWFEEQSPTRQRAILGPGRYEAWRQGMFRFEDVLKRVPNRTWGESLQTRSLRELVG